MKRRGNRDLVKEQFWRKALARFADSGLSRVGFCEQERLPPHALSYWQHVILERDAEKKTARRPAAGETTQTFIPIVVPESNLKPLTGHGAVAEIVFAGGSILLFNGIDAATLRTILQALRFR